MYEIEIGTGCYSKAKCGNEYFSIGKKKSNFQIKEFACKDGTDVILVNDELVEKLQIMRSYFNVPIIINSGYRTNDYNAKVGGVNDSQHTLGKAADIVVRGINPKAVADFAKRIGFTGVGTYKDFVHVDVRENKSYWNG